MRLPERVTFKAATTTTDTLGGRSVAWAAIPTAPTVAAAVLPLQPVERLQAGAIGSNATYTVVVRYRADITPAMRLEWTPYRASTPKVLEIHGVGPHDGGRQYLSIACGEVI